MGPNDEIPDVSKWQPRSDRSDTLDKSLLMTCQAIQSRILSEANVEKGFNIDNFDSGSGLEDIVRRQLSELLPSRYSVDAGVVNDRNGLTAGDYEILIRNGIWSPAIKLGATPASRRFHYSVESIYSAIEVKQTLGYGQLDKAMEKLVKVSRLNRPLQQYGHITENQHLRFLDKQGFVLNPLRTIVLATGIQKGMSFRNLAIRFANINGRLGRDHMVSELCVLGHGVIWYSTKNSDGGFIEATNMWDRDQQLYLSVSDKEPDKVFFQFFAQLLGHLTRSVTWTPDVHIAYGAQYAPPAEHFERPSALYNL